LTGIKQIFIRLLTRRLELFGRGFSTIDKNLRAALLLPVIFAVLLHQPSIGLGMESAQPPVLSKDEILRNVAESSLLVGKQLFEKELFESSLKSLLEAQRYQIYLNESSSTMLDSLLEKAKAAMDNRDKMLAKIRQANSLLMQGQMEQARAILYEAKDSKYFTEKERKIAAEGIVRIDNLLNKTTSPEAVTRQSPGLEEIPVIGQESEVVGKEELLDEMVDVIGIVPAVEDIQEVTPEVSGPSYADLMDRKRKLIQSYGRAKAKDAMTNVQQLVEEGKYFPARESLEAAQRAVEENMHHLDEGIYNHYKIELMELSERIEVGRNKWLGK
jgi:hypothetical protein